MAMSLSIGLGLNAIIAAGAGGPTNASARMFGANISINESYMDSRAYTDLVMTARAFAPVGNPYASVDTEGVVLPAVNASGYPTESFVILLGALMDQYTAGTGTYEGSYEHATQLTISAGECSVQNHREHSPGVWRFEVVLTGQGTPVLTFTGVGAAGLTSLKVIRPGYEWNTTQKFTNEWLAIMADYSFVRTMDITLTSGLSVPGREYFCNGGQTTWATRWTPTGTAAGKIWERHSLENCADIANATGKDLWVNIPHRATDDYIEGMFNFLDANVDPGLKIIVEYSNEIWNYSPGYQAQLQYCSNQSRLELDWFGGDTLASDIASASVSSNVVTVDFARVHGRTTGQQVKVALNDVPVGAYTVTVTSPTQFTFPVSGVADGPVTLNSSSMIVMNASSDLAFDFVTGSTGPDAFFEGTQNRYTWAPRYGAKRLAAAKNILASINPALIGSRFRFVAALQFSNIPKFSTDWLKYLNSQHGPVSSWLWAISGAPYITAASSSANADAAIASLSASLLENRGLYWQWVACAKALGVEFVPYELGTDLAVLGAVNPSIAASTGADTRLTQIVDDTMQDAAKMGALQSGWFTEGAGDTGWSFLTRRKFDSTDSTDPKLKGVHAALYAPKAAISVDWSTSIQPADPTTTDAFKFSGYAIYHPEQYNPVGVSGAKNLIFGGGAFGGVIKPRLIFVTYVPVAGDYSLVWQLGSNGSPGERDLDLFLDGAKVADMVAGEANPYTEPCPDTAPVALALTAGWHVFKAQTKTANSAVLGARQFKLTPA